MDHTREHRAALGPLRRSPTARQSNGYGAPGHRRVRLREAGRFGGSGCSGWCAVALTAVCLVGCAREAQCSDAPPAGPTNLKDCYLRVAMEKPTADTAYIAKTICDEVFGRWPLSVFILESEGGKCTAWTFDDLGHYESAEVYCALEPAGEVRWTFSCESKNPKVGRFGVVELKETDTGYERAGPVLGHDPGAIFKTLAACLKAKSAP